MIGPSATFLPNNFVPSVLVLPQYASRKMHQSEVLQKKKVIQLD